MTKDCFRKPDLTQTLAADHNCAAAKAWAAYQPTPHRGAALKINPKIMQTHIPGNSPIVQILRQLCA